MSRGHPQICHPSLPTLLMPPQTPQRLEHSSKNHSCGVDDKSTPLPTLMTPQPTPQRLVHPRQLGQLDVLHIISLNVDNAINFDDADSEDDLSIF